MVPVLVEGKKITAYILIVTGIGEELRVKDRIREIANEYSDVASIDARPLFGEYDLIAIVEAPNINVVDNIVTRIRRLEGVNRTVTLIAS